MKTLKLTLPKTLISLGIIAVLGTLSGLVYTYLTVEVSHLSSRYPVPEIKNRRVHYSFTRERPVHWVALEEISPVLQGAVVVTEDWSFYQHHGVDFSQVRSALMDISNEARLRGASTITQQMVKNVLLTPERTLWRKLKEMVLAWKVEKHLSKKRILEIYLNSIEYGPGIFGIRRASKYYFGKHPSEVSPREAAFIAMMLPNPRIFVRSFKDKKLTPYATQRLGEILIKMRMGKIITAEDYATELQSTFGWEIR